MDTDFPSQCHPRRRKWEYPHHLLHLRVREGDTGLGSGVGALQIRGESGRRIFRSLMVTENNKTKTQSTMPSFYPSPPRPHPSDRLLHRRAQVRAKVTAWRGRLSSERKEEVRRRDLERKRVAKSARDLLALGGGHIPMDRGAQEREMVKGKMETTDRDGTFDVSRTSESCEAVRVLRPRQDGPTGTETDPSIGVYSSKLTVAPSRLDSGGRGLFVRCRNCCRHPPRRFFSTTPNGRKQEYKTYAENPSLASAIRRKVMCSSCDEQARLGTRRVFRQGETIACYFGKRVGFGSTGPYIVEVGPQEGSLNARHWVVSSSMRMALQQTCLATPRSRAVSNSLDRGTTSRSWRRGTFTNTKKSS